MIVRDGRVRHNWRAPCVYGGPVQLGEMDTSDFAGHSDRASVVQGNIPTLGSTLACNLWVAGEVTVCKRSILLVRAESCKDCRRHSVGVDW
jgi:hypothetical protein